MFLMQSLSKTGIMPKCSSHLKRQNAHANTSEPKPSWQLIQKLKDARVQPLDVVVLFRRIDLYWYRISSYKMIIQTRAWEGNLHLFDIFLLIWLTEASKIGKDHLPFLLLFRRENTPLHFQEESMTSQVAPSPQRKDLHNECKGKNSGSNGSIDPMPGTGLSSNFRIKHTAIRVLRTPCKVEPYGTCWNTGSLAECCEGSKSESVIAIGVRHTWWWNTTRLKWLWTLLSYFYL